MSNEKEKHYHVLWVSQYYTRFDVTQFGSEGEANEFAKSLVRPEETWDLVEVEGMCSMDCLAWLARRKIIRGHSRESS